MSQSRFGRIPNETVKLLEATRDVVQHKVTQALPPTAPQAVRDLVVERVITFVLRDWRENGNTNGLIESDVEDMKNFVSAAVQIAGPDINNRNLPVFSAVLTGMLEDWLANWNSEGDPGPPGPVD